jgi:hypothetical protein
MPSNDTIELEGMKEINAILTKLPAQMHAKALQSIHRTAANKVVKVEMTANAPDGAMKHIKVGNDKENPTGVVVGIKKSGFKFRWQEYGTTVRKTKKGKVTGKINSKPFIRPAIDRSSDSVIKFIKDNYSILVGRFIKRNLRKVNKANQ